MRTWILVLTLGLVAGCTHKTHETQPATPAPQAAPTTGHPAAANAGQPAATNPAQPAAATGDAAAAGTAGDGAGGLPATVPLVRFNLAPYTSGRLDYHATDGKTTVETHQAMSKSGVTHVWNSSAPKGVYLAKATTYKFDDGKCVADTGTLGKVGFAMAAQGAFQNLRNPLFGLTKVVSGDALHLGGVGAGTVRGTTATWYTFDVQSTAGLIGVEVKGEVALDAGHAPVASKGTVTAVKGPGAKDLAPVSWEFAATDLNGDVSVALPPGCTSAQAGLNAIASLPTPPSKSGTASELGGVTTYAANAKAPQVVAFFKTSLPAQGWTVDTSNALSLSAHKGKTKVVIAVLPQGDTSMVTIRQP